MEFETHKSHVYIKVDEKGRITRCEGEYTLPSDLTDWILIEEGQPCDRLNLAQSHYFDGGLYTMDGIPRYKLDGSAAVLRTEEELEADRAARPALPPTTGERIANLEEQLAQSDETAITLYEAQEAQEAINSQQDEALMEIYEMISL